MGLDMLAFGIIMWREKCLEEQKMKKERALGEVKDLIKKDFRASVIEKMFELDPKSFYKIEENSRKELSFEVTVTTDNVYRMIDIARDIIQGTPYQQHMVSFEEHGISISEKSRERYFSKYQWSGFKTYRIKFVIDNGQNHLFAITPSIWLSIGTESITIPKLAEEESVKFIECAPCENKEEPKRHQYHNY